MIKSFLYKKAEKQEKKDFPGPFKVLQAAVLGPPHNSPLVTALTYRNILGSGSSPAHLFPAEFPACPRGIQGGEKQQRSVTSTGLCGWAASERRNSQSLL